MGTQDKTTLTAEQWEDVRSRLSGSFGIQRLQIDGQMITLEVRRYKALRFCIIVFVNGRWKWEWCQDECDNRRKFCRPTKQYLYKKRDRDELLKSIRRLPKNMRDESLERINKFHCFYAPIWFDFSALKRHLERECLSIAIAPIVTESEPQTKVG